MKIGYPCINWMLKATPKKFRLASYSEQRLCESVEWNLYMLEKILSWNLERGFLFFRISSDIVPFASHKVNTFNWQEHFKKKFKEIGDFVRAHGIRISMHPNQFVLINALDEKILERSIAEIEYHCDVLDLMGLDESAKVQIHVGGVYGDKEKAIERFVERYGKLSSRARKRLVIENDDKLFSVSDCLKVSEKTGAPIVFDYFHHLCLNSGESVLDAMQACASTWTKSDGILMVDYSSQKEGFKRGTHIDSIDAEDFKRFLSLAEGIECDVMLEIKDKEKSAEKSLSLIRAFQ